MLLLLACVPVDLSVPARRDKDRDTATSPDTDLTDTAPVDTGATDTTTQPAIDCTEPCEDVSSQRGEARCYSCQCKSAMDGWLPSPEDLQCGWGEEIVIYTAEEDGSLTPVSTRTSTCANPTLLYGTCDPGGRLGQLTHGDIEVKWICRRNSFVEGASEDMELPYDDVGAILYNNRTGASCWFDDVDRTGIAGWNFPDLDLNRPEAPDAVDDFRDYFYNTNGDGCVGCHDNDPFNYTPYLQSVGWVTGEWTYGPFTRVLHNGELRAMDSSHLVSPAAARCTQCHRITSDSTCSTWAPDSLGAEKNRAYEQRVIEAAEDEDSPLWYLATWMPFGETVTDHDEWDKDYAMAKESVLACCARPGVNTFEDDGTPICEWEPMPEG